MLAVLGVELLVCIGLVIAIHVYGQVDEAQNADVIVVLGAGLRYDGTAGPALVRRSIHAADLYHAGYAPAIICTGGTGDWGRPESEAGACRDVLIDYGVPEDAIYMEQTSRSTEENALNVRPILEQNGWNTVLLVSDKYHMLRAQWIFNSVGISIIPSPTVNPSIPTYLISVAREVAALHWQAAKTLLGIPLTNLPSV